MNGKYIVMGSSAESFMKRNGDQRKGHPPAGPGQ